MEKHRVVVIQDASSELISPSAIRWAIDTLKLISGDRITLLGVLHQVDTPMGYKFKVDSNSMFAANKKMIKEAVARKVQEYQSNTEIMDLGTLCESREIDFKIEVAAGSSRKETAVELASNLKATWVILDRQMRKDKKYFLQKLSCGISQMKDDNSVELLRGRKSTGTIIRHLVPVQNHGINGEETVQAQPPRAAQEPSPSGQEPSPSSQEPSAAGKELRGIEISREEVDESRQNEDPPTTESAGDEGPLQTWQVEIGGGDSGCKFCNNKRPHYGYKRDFTYEELHDSTGGFSPENCLSSEEFGSAFKGELEDGMKIVVKMKNNVFLDKGEFESEVNVLCRAWHKNVITLLGSCGEGNSRLLVYEYACNGSLDQHISEHSSRPLTWRRRINIALSAARGLRHLHENHIIHMDIRLNNILLTHYFEPLIGEWGITRKKYDSDKFSEDRVRYSDYQAPEYTDNRMVSSKTDVYSFGVVLLELITGRIVMEMALRETSLLDWARPLLSNKKYLELADSRLGKSYDLQQLLWMVQVTQNCLAKNPKRRLSMDRVVSALEFIAEKSIAIKEPAVTQQDAQVPEDGGERS
ncbi:hypothetical protein CRG98_021881 [Punica granatum]|uniref:non-specific serine/threonine protein kinase n=1 Tax=Punica granatum TaxID=22663 RepID=A0A2I0JNF1_PUNGR|nr:hypothetical protein CRG98_021881 [Punica granatum]